MRLMRLPSGIWRLELPSGAQARLSVSTLVLDHHTGGLGLSS